jgi:hypothetical protein
MADLALKTKEEIFDLIKRTAEELYPDADWSGLRTGTFEWLMAKVVAEMSVLNGQYLDLRSDNAYLSTANVRKDIRDIAANLGLTPNERAGATVTLTFAATADATVPKGTRVVSSNGEIFSTTAALVLSTATSLTGDILAVHSDYEQITYRARGDAGETVDLNRDDVLVDQLKVFVDDVEWERVDNLFGQTSASQVYIAVFDERNRVSVKFGNGTFGQRLPADAEVLVDVFTGGGPGGNAVGAASLTTVLDTFQGSGNISSVTNASAPSGGKGADSLDEIAEKIPGQLRQIAGLINPEDISKVIKANLNFVADANARRGHTKINGVFVPTVTVAAYPHDDAISDLSASQSSELSDFLTNRGELGAVFSAEDAYAAPVELELEVRLSNRSLTAQKEAEIKAALVTNDDALFAFKNLGFVKEFTLQDILSTVQSVPGVLFAQVNRFAKIPHALSVSGFSTAVDGFADIELGPEAEDGYFQFRATDSQDADVSFMRPFRVTKVGADFVRSSEANYIVEEHSYESGAEFNDTEGPYVKLNGTKLEFK